MLATGYLSLRGWRERFGALVVAVVAYQLRSPWFGDTNWVSQGHDSHDSREKDWTDAHSHPHIKVAASSKNSLKPRLEERRKSKWALGKFRYAAGKYLGSSNLNILFLVLLGSTQCFYSWQIIHIFCRYSTPQKMVQIIVCRYCTYQMLAMIYSTLWLFNVAMENCPFIEDLWWFYRS